MKAHKRGYGIERGSFQSRAQDRRRSGSARRGMFMLAVAFSTTCHPASPRAGLAALAAERFSSTLMIIDQRLRRAVIKFSILRGDEALPDLRLRSMHNPEKKDSTISAIAEGAMSGLSASISALEIWHESSSIPDGMSVCCYRDDALIVTGNM
jgi:hypothetical protein